MQKIIHLIILLFIIFNRINAQYILSRQVISNLGGSISMAGITLDYTAGETFSSEINNNSYAVNQGFHQYFISTIAIDKLENNLLKFYPNPVSGICYLEFDKPVSEDSDLFIYNSGGRIIYSKSIKKREDMIQLDLSNLLPGNYITILKNNKNTIVSSFKLIKI